MLSLTLRYSLLALCLSGVAGCGAPPTRSACKSNVETGFVSGQNPPGVVGISVPDVYFQPANSFPPGAASVDGCV